MAASIWQLLDTSKIILQERQFLSSEISHKDLHYIISSYVPSLQVVGSDVGASIPGVTLDNLCAFVQDASPQCFARIMTLKHPATNIHTDIKLRINN